MSDGVVRLTSRDPQPGIGAVVVDDLGRTWVHTIEGYWVRTDDPDGDAESWYKVAGNYGPVTLVAGSPPEEAVPAVMPHHLMLVEVLRRLERDIPAKRVRIGFTHPHSWRGNYSELAFETCPAITVGEMLAAARSALDATFEGWKGGDFKMDRLTDCWLVNEEGSSYGETLGALLLEYLLADVVPADTPRGKAYSEMSFDERYPDAPPQLRR